jgi:hypothetical protein
MAQKHPKTPKNRSKLGQKHQKMGQNHLKSCQKWVKSTLNQPQTTIVTVAVASYTKIMPKKTQNSSKTPPNSQN